MKLTAVHAAQSKFAIAIFLEDEVMFQQAKKQYACATGKGVNNGNFVCTGHDRIYDDRGSAGAGNRHLR